LTTEVLVQGNTEADDAILGSAYMLDEEEESQEEERDCGTHDWRVVRRLTGQGEGEVCEVCPKSFRKAELRIARCSRCCCCYCIGQYDYESKVNVKMECI